MADYWHSLDRERYFKSFADIPSVPKGHVEADRNYSIRQIGSSRWLHGQDTNPLRAVMADIRAGAGHIELTAPGVGRGGGGNPTFEEIDRQQREELREIQKAVDVSITTHATPSVWGLTGLDPRSGQFNEAERENNMKELFKAIDFASEATMGGSVVVHTGEFQRPLYNMPGHEGKFQLYEKEHESAHYLVVDEKDERLISQIAEDKMVYVPEYERDEKGKIKYMKDDKGNFIKDDIGQNIPVYKMDPETHNVKVNGLKFEEYVDYQIKHNKENIQEQLQKMGVDPNLVSTNPQSSYVKEAVAVEFAREQIKTQLGQQLGQMEFYNRRRSDSEHAKESLNEEIERIDLILKNPDNDPALREMRNRDPDTFNQNIKMLEKRREGMRQRIDDADREIRASYEPNVALQQAVNELREKMDKLRPMRTFALDKSEEAYAKLGLYAMEKTDHLKKQWSEKNQGKLKPIFISMENVYPSQGYGSEVDELIHLVEGSRNKMAEMLQKEYGKKADEAKKLAEQHIKVTFDTGHFNMWKRFFKRDGHESEEQYDRRFKEWYAGQFKKLAEKNMIGNVHIADNFGYDDSHLAPTMGDAPVREVMEMLKKSGYKGEFAVEGGFNQGVNGFHMAWSELANSAIYSPRATAKWVDVGASFGDVYQSYHRHRHRPYFVFGKYSPDSDDWKPWSGTNME